MTRWLPLLLMIMLLSALPVAANDFAETFDSAGKARAEGRFADAERHYRKALSLSPDNTDVLLQLGLVLGYQERHTEALMVLNKGIALAPDYIDIRIARARIKLWMGSFDAARAGVAGVLARAPENPEAQDLQRQLDALHDEENKIWWRLDTGYEQSRFSRVTRKNWHEGYTQITYADKETQVHIRSERGRRFGEFDTYVRAGVAHRLNGDLGGYFNYGMTPSASFYPRWKVETGADYRLHSGGRLLGPTIVTLDLAQKNYATGDIRNIDPGMQQYLFNGSAWLTGRWINTYDLAASTRLGGWSFRADWQALDQVRVFSGIASAAETDNNTSVITLSRFIGTSINVTPDFGLNIAFTRNNRKNAYIRDVFSGGLSLRF